jgi:twitching motility protein PilT
MSTIPIEDLLRLALEEEASDVHLAIGAPPVLRIRGSLVKLNVAPLNEEDVAVLVAGIANESAMERVNTEGSVDFAFSFLEENRFRVSVYRERGRLAAALRIIPRKLLSLEEIGLPAAVRELLDAPRGLVLVTGPTGSGKTTSLASMLSVIVEKHRSHVITIEDPIEYYLDHRSGLVHQREVGVDVPSFAEGLRRALRQDPDVILVGEMRDLETVETAITAAETGHLVFSTLHTTGAARTIDRVIDAFPADRQEQVRVQMSTNLRAVISQLLLPKKDGSGRIAIFEVMINTPAIAALIRDRKSFRIGSEIQTGTKYGMLSLEAALAEMFQRGVVRYEEIMAVAQDPQALRQLLGEKIDT